MKDTERQQVAEALRDRYGSYEQRGYIDCGEVTDTLAPVIDRIANQRAAEELEAEAAYDDAAPDEQYARGLFARRLRVRAKNLRGDALTDKATP